MKAKHGDAEVCPACNGTGQTPFMMGRYSYSKPCTRKPPYNTGQLTLAMPARKEPEHGQRRQRGPVRSRRRAKA